MEDVYYPLAIFGLKGNLFSFHPYLFLYAIYGFIIVIIICCLFRFLYSFEPTKMSKESTIWIGRTIYDFIYETVELVTLPMYTLAFFLVFCILGYSLVGLLPHCHEPLKDLNVTLPIALITFFMIHKIAFSIQGISYINHWMATPLTLKTSFFSNSYLQIIERIIRIIVNVIIAICSFPLEAVGRLALIISLSFRLFGNVFAGSILSELANDFFGKSILYKIIGMTTGISFIVMLFSLSEGIIQAGVFVLIAINNIAILISDNH